MSTCNINPVTGNYRFSCPRCSLYLSIQRYIDLKSDWTMCKGCGLVVNVPSLVNSTQSKTKHSETRTVSKVSASGRLSRRIVPVVGQLTIFGGIE